MTETIQVNDSTSFRYEDGALIPLEEAEQVEEEAAREWTKLRRENMGQDEGWMLVPSFIEDRNPILYTTMKKYILDRVGEYLAIKGELQVDFTKKGTYKSIMDSLYTSDLLERLLSGKPALSEAPPKTYEYYWYNLIDEGEDICIDVYFVQGFGTPPTNPYINVDGHRWDIIETIEADQEYKIHPEGKKDQHYRLVRVSEEDINRLLHPRLHKCRTKSAFAWKLQALEQENDQIGDSSGV